MPAKRQYSVKGTKDFIVLAGIFFFLCLWSIKDAWFPSDKVIKKHPQEVVATFEEAGTVQKVNVAVGDTVTEKTVLAKLRSDKITVDYDDAKEAYAQAKAKYAAVNTSLQKGDTSVAAADVAAAKAAMDQSLANVESLKDRLDSSELIAPSKGEIKEAYVGVHSLVEAGQKAFLIDPKDHFYLFNKSLAVFSFFLFWLFLIIHILAR